VIPPQTKPSLLLHICCGPCATTVIERLTSDYTVCAYFYNPNIFPAEEYERRLEAARKVAQIHNIEFIEGLYEPETFEKEVKGLEAEPENGARCKVCYRLRFQSTAREAQCRGITHMAGTLTLGPMKKATVINPIGVDEAKKVGIVFVEGDWKKKDGFKRACELSQTYGLYRQHYCGCRYSMRGENS